MAPIESCEEARLAPLDRRLSLHPARAFSGHQYRLRQMQPSQKDFNLPTLVPCQRLTILFCISSFLPLYARPTKFTSGPCQSLQSPRSAPPVSGWNQVVMKNYSILRFVQKLRDQLVHSLLTLSRGGFQHRSEE
ncbi:hypothetical protein IE53DRAFT_52591 [Violaceomyces palustris]|uniref:Uncharacterized protein n=1 Tax=Violaceomyces palustris TaxID=1673888 RepID=A0ACD0P038_9BASI|nr:hypothetical protein IE53DRAFT_52591 [Violaceomyces palustris]